METQSISKYFEFNPYISSINLVLSKHCKDGWEKNIPVRDEYGLILILNGALSFKFEKQTITAQKNEIVYVKKNETYTIRACGNVYFISVRFSFLGDAPPNCFLTERILKSNLEINNLFSILNRSYVSKGLCHKLECRSIFENILCKIIFNAVILKNIPQKIQASIDYISEYYSQKIDIGTLAETAGYSESYYRRQFTKIYGIAPNEYINRLRIEKAKDMLKSSFYTISEVSYHCGFLNQYYFSRVFKKFTGVSPKNFC